MKLGFGEVGRGLAQHLGNLGLIPSTALTQQSACLKSQHFRGRAKKITYKAILQTVLGTQDPVRK